MYILSLDSTAKVATVAVCQSVTGNGNDFRILGMEQLNNGNTHSETILPMAEELLDRLSLSVADIGLFAVDAGPGSFTGVRIGVSTIKGLAFGTGIPCAAISTLEALAENLSHVNGIVCPVMDARRGQVYNAIFRCRNGYMERLTADRAIALCDLVSEVENLDGNENVWLVGDGYDLATGIFAPKLGNRLCFTPPLLQAQNAVSVARIGLAAYLSGKAVTDAELIPTYLRLSQAERERNERITQNGYS